MKTVKRLIQTKTTRELKEILDAINEGYANAPAGVFDETTIKDFEDVEFKTQGALFRKINELDDEQKEYILRYAANKLPKNDTFKNILVEQLRQETGKTDKEIAEEVKAAKSVEKKKEAPRPEFFGTPDPPRYSASSSPPQGGTIPKGDIGAVVAEVEKQENDAVKKLAQIEADAPDVVETVDTVTVNLSTPVEELQQAITNTQQMGEHLNISPEESDETVDLEVNKPEVKGKSLTNLYHDVMKSATAPSAGQQPSVDHLYHDLMTDLTSPSTGTSTENMSMGGTPETSQEGVASTAVVDPNVPVDQSLSGQGTGYTGKGAVYHKTAITIFFGSADTPDWDVSLNVSIESAKPSPEECRSIMENLVSYEGPEILVSEVKSDTIQELKEILQLHWSLKRQMSRGARVPMVGLSLGSLLTLRQSLAGKPDMKPMIPVSSNGSIPNAPKKYDLSTAYENRNYWGGQKNGDGPSTNNNYLTKTLIEQNNPVLYSEKGPGLQEKQFKGLRHLPVLNTICEDDF